LFWGESPYNVR